MLLDTHVCLWLISEPSRIGADSRSRIVAGAWFSSVSVAEIQIKRHTGRLLVLDDFVDAMSEAGLRELPLTARQSEALIDLPLQLARHDPFDRLLLAQARSAGMPLVTADRRLLALGADDIVDARL